MLCQGINKKCMAMDENFFIVVLLNERWEKSTEEQDCRL